MRPGDLVDGRFEIAAHVGAGGMGSVYRAMDRETGELVALKLLRDPAGDVARFVREARALAQLTHPRVVRYVAHGITAQGQPYLVMELLAGESLEARLSRGALPIAEAVALVRALAEALSAAHALGIVHRDVKPSNVMLVGGSIADARLLDFGIARLSGVTAPTATGNVLGTPGYMAPEQARGERENLDARADVFSLGCVLFEALAGRPAFQGGHVMALLAKLLLEEPPRIGALRPEVPEPLAALCARMMAKDPAARLRDGAEVVAAIDALAAPQGIASSREPEVAAAITGAEQRLLSVVAVAPPDEEPPSPFDATLPQFGVRGWTLEVLRRTFVPLSGRVEELAGGMVVALLVGSGHAADRAALAARCALRVKPLLPGARVVLSTGRGEDTGTLPMGDVLERAGALLAAGDAPGMFVVTDPTTHALLAARFDMVEAQGRILLRGERAADFGALRTLLGKPSPCVGRDREIRHALELIDESFDEGRASAVLVTAPAGMGKSRLRDEIVARLRQREPEPFVAMGVGESVGAGSAFAMLRGAFGADGGNALGALFDPDRAASPGAPDMAARVQADCLDFLRYAAQGRPVLLVLDDLHWGDAPSVRIVDAALRELRDEPFAVLALARPEVHEVFPKLWAGRSVHELRLQELSRRAAEQMARGALGEAAPETTVAAIVERAAGNAFFLEELIRSVAEGRGEALPQTVLGMVETRLSALEPEARRCLRAASIFGEVFWRGGILSLLGERDVDALLESLVERELVTRAQEPRFPGERGYAFRHALLRDGAYAMIPERERQQGHGRAAAWLEAAGERDPLVLAQHCEQAGLGGRAAGFYLRAAERALFGADYVTVDRLVARGIACGGEDEILAQLYTIQSEAVVHGGEYARSLESARKALALARPGGDAFCQALSNALHAALFFERGDVIDDLLAGLWDLAPTDANAGVIAQAFSHFMYFFFLASQPEKAERCYRLMEEAVGPFLWSPMVRAWFEMSAMLWQSSCIERDGHAALGHAHAAAGCFEAAGERIHHALALNQAASELFAMGAFDEAEQIFRRALDAWPQGQIVAEFVEECRVRRLVYEGRLDEAHARASARLRERVQRGDQRRGEGMRMVLTAAALLSGRLDEAEREVAAMQEMHTVSRSVRAQRLSFLAELRLLQGKLPEALHFIELAAELARRGGTTSHVRLEDIPRIHAEILAALGDHASAHRLLREARADMLSRAQKIPDPALRRSFLEKIPARARLLALARAMLGDEA